MSASAAAFSMGCARGCSTRRRPSGAASNAAQTAALLPAYHPIQLLEPEIPGKPPLPDGFLTYPKQDFVRVIQQKPGRGGSPIVSMTPQWGPTPPALGRNSFVAAVNQELGIVVNPSVQDGMTYANKLSAILGARDVPDVLSVPFWEVDKIPRFSQAVKALFADLTEHLKGDAVRDYPMLATLPTDAWMHCVWGGRLSAIPYPSGGPFPYAMFHRKDIFEKRGLTPPGDIEEFYRLGKQLTDPSNSVWAFSDVFEMVQMYFGCPNSQGGWRKKPGGGLEFKYETDEYRQALEFMARLYKEQLVHPELIASKGADAKQLFKSGRIVIMQDGLGAWRPLQSEQRKITPEFDMQPLPIFSATGGEPLAWGNDQPTFYTFVKRDLERSRLQEILRVLDWLAAPFGSKEHELAQHGVEGKHFTRAPDKSPIPTELGRKEIANQFHIISGRVPVMVGTGDLPNHVRDELGYAKATVKHLEKNLFRGIKLELPPTYSKTIFTTDDKMRDLVRGRRPLSDLSHIVKEWRRSGGDDGRAFFEKALADNGR